MSSFKNNIESNSFVPDRREEEIVDNIVMLNNRLEELKKTQSDHVDKSKEVTEIETLITQKKEELSILHTNIDAAKLELSSINENNASVIKSHETVLGNVVSQVNSKNIELSELTATSDKLLNITAQAQAEHQIKAKEIEDNIANLSKELDENNTAKNTLLADIDSLNKSRVDTTEEISKINEKVNAVNDEIITKKQIVDDLDKTIALKNNEIIKLNGDIENNKLVAEKSIKNKQAELETELENRKKSADEREAALLAREGENSNKEAWLANKHTELKSAKDGLEYFFGKKIPSINL